MVGVSGVVGVSGMVGVSGVVGVSGLPGMPEGAPPIAVCYLPLISKFLPLERLVTHTTVTVTSGPGTVTVTCVGQPPAGPLGAPGGPWALSGRLSSRFIGLASPLEPLLLGLSSGEAVLPASAGPA